MHNRPNLSQFPEAVGKTIEAVSVVNTHSFRSISIQFSDKTALHFSLLFTLVVESELIDWKSGDAESIKQYPPIQEQC